MFVIRKIGKFLRGKATPFQIVMAATLGAALGFVPGFVHAPGLMLALFALLVVLNANLLVAGVVGVLAYLASLALMPVSFALGRMLLDGPTRPIFKALINAPVTAWFGFEHYAVTGGLALGVAFGLIAGLALAGLLTRFRLRMASLEEGSERFKQFTSKGWVKLATFVFVGGGRGKSTWADLARKKVGNPIRALGVVLVALAVGLGVIVYFFFAEPIVTAATRSALERANGATVDLESVVLEPESSRLTLRGLAMADPNALDTNLFAAETIELDVSSRELLRRRVAIDRAVASNATRGERRAIPGQLVGEAVEPPPSQTQGGDILPDERTIEDYVRQAEVWKDRLEQARRWIEKASGPGEEETVEGEPAEETETLEERLRRRVETEGYANVTADHLIDAAPTLLIRELVIEGLRAAELEGELIDVHARNLSTHPRLVEAAPEIEVRTRSDRMAASLSLREIAAGSGANALSFHLSGLATDDVMASLKFADAAPLTGGTIDVAAEGAFTGAYGGSVELPLRVTLHNTTLRLPDGSTSNLSSLQLPIGVRGPIANPRIAFDETTFTDALVAAGKAELANRFNAEAEKAVDDVKNKATEKINEKLGEELGEQGRRLFDNILGGDKDEGDGGR